MGTIAPKTGIAPFTELVAHVMSMEPYASARLVFWVVDNGSSHAGQASIDRMNTAWPTATLVHLPVHASWLNQVEIYFSVLQRKAISQSTSPTSTPSPSASSPSRTATTGQHPVRLDLQPHRPPRTAQPDRPTRAEHHPHHRCLTPGRGGEGDDILRNDRVLEHGGCAPAPEERPLAVDRLPSAVVIVGRFVVLLRHVPPLDRRRSGGGAEHDEGSGGLPKYCTLRHRGAHRSEPRSPCIADGLPRSRREPS
jgi:hypothetical protein